MPRYTATAIGTTELLSVLQLTMVSPQACDWMMKCAAGLWIDDVGKPLLYPI